MNNVEELIKLTMTSPEDVIESIQAADEAFDARCAIELGVAEMTVGHLSEEDLSGLKHRLEAMRPLIRENRFVDFERYLIANNDYHEYLVGLAKNETLLSAYRSLKIKGLMVRALGGTSKTSDRVIEDHIQLTDAFAAGDFEMAKTAIKDHTALAKHRVREAAADQGLIRYLARDQIAG